MNTIINDNKATYIEHTRHMIDRSGLCGFYYSERYHKKQISGNHFRPFPISFQQL